MFSFAPQKSKCEIYVFILGNTSQFVDKNVYISYIPLAVFTTTVSRNWILSYCTYVEEITKCIPAVPTLTYVWDYTFTSVLVFKAASVPHCLPSMTVLLHAPYMKKKLLKVGYSGFNVLWVLEL